jgi:hypothetical protein
MSPLVEKTGDEAHVRKAEETLAKRRERELEDLKRVMESPVGRRVIARIYSECDPMKDPFDVNGSRTNLNLGTQRVGRFLAEELDAACPELFLAMRREMKE